MSYSDSPLLQGFGAFYVVTISVTKPVAFVFFKKVIHFVFSYTIPSALVIKVSRLLNYLRLLKASINSKSISY